MQTTADISTSLSRQDTGALKGIAIIAMLFHHIYAFPPADIEPYHGLLAFLGTIGKVCVSIFLFCSAYGLSQQYNGTDTIVDSLKFVLKRLVKFYLNYWVIFLIFVPISVFVFSRPLTAAYGETTIWKALCRDLLGLQGFSSYNVTWWFNELIIKFYILFPIAYYLCRKIPALFVLSSIALYGIGVEVDVYWFVFISGILWHQYEATISRYLNRLPQWLLIVTSVLLCIGASWIRGLFHNLLWDMFFTWTFVLLTITLLRLCQPLMKGLSFLGKHSGNIYMTHTFIYSYWLSKYVYICDLRIGGIAVVLVICLLLSVLIEYMKARAGVYKLSSYIVQHIEQY